MTDSTSGSTASWLVASEDDYFFFVDEALRGMVAILRQLGDEHANQRPDLDGANSAYAILTHCLGVMEFWGGANVAERTITRDREAEFVAVGAVDDLIERVATARRQLETDVSGFDPLAAPPHVAPKDEGTPLARTKGGVLLHILEELLQHLGQMELTRDILLKED